MVTVLDPSSASGGLDELDELDYFRDRDVSIIESTGDLYAAGKDSHGYYTLVHVKSIGVEGYPNTYMKLEDESPVAVNRIRDLADAFEELTLTR